MQPPFLGSPSRPAGILLLASLHLVLTCFLGSLFSFSSPCPADLGLPVPPPGTVVPARPPPRPPWLLSVLPRAGSCGPWKQALLCGPCRRPAAGDAEGRNSALKSAGGGRQGKHTQPGEQEGWKIPEAWASLPHHGLTPGGCGEEGKVPGPALIYLLPPEPGRSRFLGAGHGRGAGGEEDPTQEREVMAPHGQQGTACGQRRALSQGTTREGALPFCSVSAPLSQAPALLTPVSTPA